MTMVTATYPFAGAKAERPHTPATVEKRAWGFWATSGWFGVAVAAYMAASFATAFVYVLAVVLANPSAPFHVDATMIELLATATSVPAAALVLMLAARKRGWTVREYLGLTMPKLRHVTMGLGAILAYGVILTAVTYLFSSGSGDGGSSGYRQLMANPMHLVMFWLVLCVTAPVAEEIIFRGFLMRGWSESKLGVVITLLLTTVLFAAIHTQYNIYGMGVVAGLGLMFGIARLRTGSTVLAIIMHSAWNLSVGLIAAFNA